MTTDSYIADARKGPSSRKAPSPNMAKVRNVIAVGSGKGGVGKSTVTVNLAAALARLGASVGVLDADVYGPSQPQLLGASDKKADLNAQTLMPLEAHGIKFMSVQTLLPQDGPVVWRAPMAVKLLQDFIAHVGWGELDYLLIDMPPGTGDIQLTLAQGAGLTGAVVVTTPQQVALGIARKGLQMFSSVKVPILGIVENMAGHVCVKCGHHEDTFMAGGGAALAKESGTALLGALPLDAAIVKSGETGVPVVEGEASAALSKAFVELARAFEREVAASNMRASAGPKSIDVSAAGALDIVWADGVKQTFNPYHLRLNCPCAGCVDEHTGEKILDAKRVALNIKVAEVRPVGSYGVAPKFSDGHDTGIFTFERLKALAGPSDSAPLSFSV